MSWDDLIADANSGKISLGADPSQIAAVDAALAKWVATLPDEKVAQLVETFSIQVAAAERRQALLNLGGTLLGLLKAAV